MLNLQGRLSTLRNSFVIRFVKRRRERSSFFDSFDSTTIRSTKREENNKLARKYLVFSVFLRRPATVGRSFVRSISDLSSKEETRTDRDR